MPIQKACMTALFRFALPWRRVPASHGGRTSKSYSEIFMSCDGCTLHFAVGEDARPRQEDASPRQQRKQTEQPCRGVASPPATVGELRKAIQRSSCPAMAALSTSRLAVPIAIGTTAAGDSTVSFRLFITAPI
jgi:hypothetical protein